MRNPLGYKVLRTYQQGEQIYSFTKQFTSTHLHPLTDRRLIAHMDDSARSVPRNIAEGYGRNNTKQYYEFLGFSYGSLIELLEDYFELEKDIKGGQRVTKDNNGALGTISRAIKLCMGERTMLKKQMEQIEQMAGDQGLKPHRQKVAEIMAEQSRSNKEFDRFILSELEKARKQKEGQ